jgi:hypothetical protein
MIWYISTYILSHISVVEHVIGTFIHTYFPLFSKLCKHCPLIHEGAKTNEGQQMSIYTKQLVT